MQYWKPNATDEFAGDRMPYWDGEGFHLFCLPFFAASGQMRVENLQIAPIENAAPQF